MWLGWLNYGWFDDIRYFVSFRRRSSDTNGVRILSEMTMD